MGETELKSCFDENVISSVSFINFDLDVTLIHDQTFHAKSTVSISFVLF